MNELASQPSNMHGHIDRPPMPRRLWGALIAVGLQVLANAFVGWVILAGLSEEASQGDAAAGASVAYFAAYLSVAFAGILAVCVVFTVRPRSWARPIIMTVEGLGVISSLISVFNGAVAGLFGILLAIAVISVLTKPDVRDWYESGPFNRAES